MYGKFLKRQQTNHKFSLAWVNKSEFSLLRIEKSEKQGYNIAQDRQEVRAMQYENERVEYKSQLVDDIYKEVIAFANTDGGVIYVGIDDL